MTKFPSGQVPSDMWICGICKGPNLIALTNEKCPVCGHTRDHCCIGPNEPYTDTAGLFPEVPITDTTSNFDLYPGAVTSQLNPAVHYLNQCLTFKHGAHNSNWYEPSHVYEHDIVPISTDYVTSSNFTTLAGAGSPAPGIWSCTCGATNSELTPDFCPVCGEAR